MSTLAKYVIVTPARNEARFIELTLRSVVEQTVLPLRWVIVSDGSTDGTDEVVSRYAAEHPWIELVRMPERVERNFAGKVLAFNAGYAKVKDLAYEVIASLDGDISFDPDYFEFLLGKMFENSALGVVGTPFQELSGQVYDYRFVSIEHVSGACQVFRRECFDAISGYKPMKGGSIDHVAVISARMRGWQTRSFTEKVCTHHREMGTAQQGILKARFRHGLKDYRIGNHPLWEVFRAVHQMTHTPWLVGGLALGIGYTWAAVRRLERPVPCELVRFHRREQLSRLKRKLKLRRTKEPEMVLAQIKTEIRQSTK
jgi:biofilm PGA synthesis N-glycosyltransferase PgaC